MGTLIEQMYFSTPTFHILVPCPPHPAPQTSMLAGQYICYINIQHVYMIMLLIMNIYQKDTKRINFKIKYKKKKSKQGDRDDAQEITASENIYLIENHCQANISK